LSGVGRLGTLARGLRCVFIVTPRLVGGVKTVGEPLWFCAKRWRGLSLGGT